MEPTALDHCDETCCGSDEGLDMIRSALAEEAVAAKMAELFKALGDPTRVKILLALSKQELCVHDLTQVLDMNQSAVSHQLRYLRNLHIVKRRKAGKTVYYSLEDTHVEQIFLQTYQHIHHS